MAGSADKVTPPESDPVIPVSDLAVRCEHCGHAMCLHYGVTLTPEGHIWLVCPTSMFRAPGYDATGKRYPDDWATF
jgi:hypothetical protein